MRLFSFFDCRFNYKEEDHITELVDQVVLHLAKTFQRMDPSIADFYS